MGVYVTPSDADGDDTARPISPPPQGEKYNARLGVPRRGEAGRIRALLLIL